MFNRAILKLAVVGNDVVYSDITLLVITIDFSETLHTGMTHYAGIPVQIHTPYHTRELPWSGFNCKELDKYCLP